MPARTPSTPLPMPLARGCSSTELLLTQGMTAVEVLGCRALFLISLSSSLVVAQFFISHRPFSAAAFSLALFTLFAPRLTCRFSAFPCLFAPNKLEFSTSILSHAALFSHMQK